MIAGYVRLSRDDDGQNYTSIENQKLLILQYARSQNMAVDCWFEDDGVSGYRFDRPQFQRMMTALTDGGIDVLLVKDFSRLGRHNAKVLLLLDEFQRRGCRLIAVDDNYDSLDPDDDIIGIKTWYNERYVKDTSKKIRRVLHAKQKEGTLLTQVPFGYRRNDADRRIIEIVPEEAETVALIYDLYQQGMGYRKLAGFLSGRGVPTPSLMRLGGEPASRRRVALTWSDSMVKEILGNDFYTGVYRLHKRARRLIHGTDARVPREEQFCFPDHHPAIISPEDFSHVQQIKNRRSRQNTAVKDSPAPSPFAHLLICKDCGCRLVPITRKNKHSVRKYYICSTYNRKGKQFCPSAHLVEEWVLWEAAAYYIRLCSGLFAKQLSHLDAIPPFSKDASSKKTPPSDSAESPLTATRRQLQTLLRQKVRDLSLHPDRSPLICAAYDALEAQLLSRIRQLEPIPQPPSLRPAPQTMPSSQNAPQPPDAPPLSAAQALEEILDQNQLTQGDLDLFFDSICVDSKGIPEIRLRCFLSPALLPLHGAVAARRYAGDGV